MRLPSHSVNTHDLVRSISVAQDGPELVMDAEDYLQPQSVSVTTPEMESAIESHRPRMNGKIPNSVSSSGNLPVLVQ